MEKLTKAQEIEIANILKRRFKKYSEKAIQGMVDTLNHLRTGTMKLTDDLIPGICSYLDWVLDTGLIKYVEQIKIEENG